VRGFLQAAGLKPAVFICNEAFAVEKAITARHFRRIFVDFQIV